MIFFHQPINGVTHLNKNNYIIETIKFQKDFHFPGMN